MRVNLMIEGQEDVTWETVAGTGRRVMRCGWKNLAQERGSCMAGAIEVAGLADRCTNRAQEPGS